MIRVIHTDDHKLFSEGIERLLTGSGRFNVLGKYHNGSDLLENFSGHNPDLLLLDIDMPGLNGLDVIKRIRMKNREVKIVFLSMHEESVFTKEAELLGANGYLVKSIESNQLIESLIKVCGGTNVFPTTKSVQPKTTHILSSREIEILRLVSQGKTGEEIAARLNISPLTVKVHRRNMAKKMNASNAAELISKALESGIL